jgi:hypothetical protein
MSIEKSQTLTSAEGGREDDKLVEEMCKFIGEGHERGKEFLEFVLTSANRPFKELLEVIADQLPGGKKRKSIKIYRNTFTSH